MLAEIRYILYLMTFFAWVPLGAMAFGARGSRRRVKSLSALTALSLLACVYVLYMDFIWSKRVIAPIRVDLLLLIPLSSGLYLAMGAWGLNVWRTSHSRLMLVSSVFLVLPAAFLFVAFWYSMWSSNKTAAKIDSIPALLFDAQFKNAENFERTFRDISGTPVAGHYQSEPGAWATRVIINARGHVWLYFNCGNSECVHSEATIESGATTLPRTIALDGHVGTLYDGEIAPVGDGRFTLALQTSRDGAKHPYLTPVTFSKSPVAFRGTDQRPDSVRYWGTFAQSRVHGNDVEPIQLWLWQQDSRFIAFYIRQNFDCGKPHSFISPRFLEGKMKDDALALFNPDSIESLVMTRMTERELTGSVLYNGTTLEDLTLHPRTVFASDRFEVAPLADFQQTRTWLQTVSLGYMFTWNAECAVF